MQLLRKVKKSPEGEGLDLAGHVLVEQSRLLASFLAVSETHMVKVCGKRKR